MRVKITHNWGKLENYFVENQSDCRDENDLSAFLTLEAHPEHDLVWVGQVSAERVKKGA